MKLSMFFVTFLIVFRSIVLFSQTIPYQVWGESVSACDLFAAQQNAMRFEQQALEAQTQGNLSLANQYSQTAAQSRLDAQIIQDNLLQDEQAARLFILQKRLQQEADWRSMQKDMELQRVEAEKSREALRRSSAQFADIYRKAEAERKVAEAKPNRNYLHKGMLIENVFAMLGKEYAELYYENEDRTLMYISYVYSYKEYTKKFLFGYTVDGSGSRLTGPSEPNEFYWIQDVVTLRFAYGKSGWLLYDFTGRPKHMVDSLVANAKPPKYPEIHSPNRDDKVIVLNSLPSRRYWKRNGSY